MPQNPSDYFAYKKNKFKKDIEQPVKTTSKLSFLIQLFIATFVIMFIVIVIGIMKLSSKVDIEYSKQNQDFDNGSLINTEEENTDYNDSQTTIDKRLLLIQQEENMPNDMKLLKNEKPDNEIIDPSYIEKNKKIEQYEQEEQKKELKIKNKDQKNLEVPIPNTNEPIINQENSNVMIMSKVLVGKFSTLEDAQRLQKVIKAKDESLTPYAKKIGDVFAVQLGSYQDYETAKKQAQKLKMKGLDAWIYQQ